ncbi:conserved exported hypothetical protein [Magnetospirillum molischianum DSM 120]|uniref:Uncharacterized protein n=1 Tax=Magnetospirillum molischianum DSM 120 TaxID=1150626 RepID=H8FPZ6_MAGML|nr:conserved exported hypothetical protein [Magnetospirillum molischianum DSM 120]
MRSVSLPIQTFRQATVLISLLAFLLGGIMGSALILCFGDDGHIAVEFAESTIHTTPSAALQSADDHVRTATDCLDVPVVQAPRPSVPKTDGLPLAPLLAILCVVWCLAPRFLGNRTTDFSGPQRDVRLKLHRTVVLLN